MLKSLTKKALHRVGYDLKKKRKTQALNNIPQTPSAGIIVEFVGPSGIGKTTFFEKIKKDYKNTWLFKDDIAYTHEANDAFHLLDANEALVISRIMDLAYQILSADELPLPVKHEIHRFLIQEMKTDIFYRKKSPGKGLISEGGLLLNFGNEIIQARDELSSDLTLTVEELFKKRHIINFKANDYFILENLKKRQKELPGAGNDWVGNLGIQKAHDMIKEYNESNEKLIGLATAMGSKVLNIDAEAAFDDRKKLFENFLANISSEKAPEKVKTHRKILKQLEV